MAERCCIVGFNVGLLLESQTVRHLCAQFTAQRFNSAQVRRTFLRSNLLLLDLTLYDPATVGELPLFLREATHKFMLSESEFSIIESLAQPFTIVPFNFRAISTLFRFFFDCIPYVLSLPATEPCPHVFNCGRPLSRIF
jgi:hypothetical protein